MSYECKNPVVLIFFNRPDTLEKVFEKVRKAKPKKLFLVQDGPRNESDLEGIQKCRKIVENVDWDCEVIRDYSETNLGCGARPQTGITNALKQENQVIILEDDCVPADSFFRYCDEMLEKYKDDNRIAYISGLNHFEKWDCGGNDYFFAKSGAIAAWATWRRAWQQNDYTMASYQEGYEKNLILSQFSNKAFAAAKDAAWNKAKQANTTGQKLSYWDIQWGFVKYSQNMLVVVPARNLIHNIGVGATSTHAHNPKLMTFKKYKNFVFIPTYEIEFPITHPKFCICDTKYDDLVYKCMIGNPIRNFIAKAVKKILKK